MNKDKQYRAPPGGRASCTWLLIALSCAVLGSAAAHAQERADDDLSAVVVTATRAAGVSQRLEPNPVGEISAEGLTTLGTPGQANSFAVLQMIPGVIADAADPYGLSFTRALNVRGKSDFFLDRTLNGLPVAGIVGGADLFDLENVQAESIYAGPILANQGFGVSNATGVLDQRLLGPRHEFSAMAEQSFGAGHFHRSFLRLDSGELSTGTALFLSGSTSEASKWKGAGDAWRNNFSLGLSQHFGTLVSADLFYVHNDQKANSYAPLSYAQTQNLGQYYYFDYSTVFTPTPASARNQYYGFYLQHFTDDAVLGNVTVRLPDSGSLSFKPYYWKDRGVNNLQAGQNVRYWPQDKDNYGGVIQYDTALGQDGRLSAGYWYQSMSPDPPPVAQQNYTVTAQGTLQFLSWATLGQFTHHEFKSPYLQLTDAFGGTTITAGVRYLIEGTPQMAYYLTKGLPGVSYSQVFQFNPALDPNGQAPTRTFHEWLPNVGIHRPLTSNIDLDVSYSRKIARVDYGPQASSFFGAESAFTKHGMTLQTLMSVLEPEMDDEIDAALAIAAGSWSFTPDLYAYKAHNKEVLVADPVTGQSFYQSNASTTGYGIDLSIGYRWSDAFSAFVGGSAASETYDQNIPIAGTTAPKTLFIEGKQVPNDPKFTLKGAINYRLDGLTLAPDVRFISRRYGLADNSQSVASFAVADLTASFDLTRYLHLRDAHVSLMAQNLFNRHYIDVISVNEDNLSTTSYYAGAPRTVSGTFEMRF
jgi:iron complex outermembrane receptor protein